MPEMLTTCQVLFYLLTHVLYPDQHLVTKRLWVIHLFLVPRSVAMNCKFNSETFVSLQNLQIMML